ncbi:MAG: hypothetical protein P8H98_00215 [Flavobacteriales bacterium]|nr:hypothetical protein [Flavobacteriales bacterium]
MYTIFTHLRELERVFNQRHGWFFINGMKAQDPEYWKRLDLQSH